MTGPRRRQVCRDRRTLILVCGVLALLTTGCRMELDVDVTLDREGRGRLGVELAADAELLRRAAGAGADPLGDVLAAGRALRSDGWQATDTRLEDGSRRVRLESGFDSPEELQRLSSELAAALHAPEVDLLNPFVVTLTDDRVTVAAGAGLVPTAVVAESGFQPADAVRLAKQDDAVSYELAVTLPGDVLESTAASVEGRTATWTVVPGEAVEVRVVAVRPARRTWPVVLGGALGLGASGVALWFVTRRRAPARLRPAHEAAAGP